MLAVDACLQARALTEPRRIRHQIVMRGAAHAGVRHRRLCRRHGDDLQAQLGALVGAPVCCHKGVLPGSRLFCNRAELARNCNDRGAIDSRHSRWSFGPLQGSPTRPMHLCAHQNMQHYCGAVKQVQHAILSAALLFAAYTRRIGQVSRLPIGVPCPSQCTMTHR